MANKIQEKFKRHGKPNGQGFQLISKPVKALACARCKRTDKQPRQYTTLFNSTGDISIPWDTNTKGFCCLKCALEHTYAAKAIPLVMKEYSLTDADLVKA